jgi:hypothetical protein
MSDTPHEMHERWILKTELLWAFGVGVFIAAALSMILFTALTISVNPPSNVERIDPKTLHLSGEFAEHNLGTTVSGDGAVTVRAIATQFMFVPQCVVVPANRRVTLRFARLTSSMACSLPVPTSTRWWFRAMWRKCTPNSRARVIC